MVLINLQRHVSTLKNYLHIQPEDGFYEPKSCCKLFKITKLC